MLITLLTQSIEAVSLWQFVVATLFLLPKVFLVVFVGSRIAKFSDGGQRDQMDTSATIVASSLE